MSSANNELKRQVSSAPHKDGFFKEGEFIYEPDARWTALRTGMIVLRNKEWRVTLAPLDAREDWIDKPLASFAGRIARHILIDNSGVGTRRGPAIDPGPWLKIGENIRALLRDSETRRIRLDQLIARLHAQSELDSDLIEDTLRMYASMGYAKVTEDADGLWYGLSRLLEDGFNRRDFLATFSDELLAKSRRIDHLIGHTGTVGSYREDLLRTTIQQLLPARFQASTGFIENSPRQLNIIIWDAGNYGPLFRERDVVVVPREAVRGIIEVKAALDTGALDDALEILYDVTRVDPPTLPVFKGIFAFHQGYKSDSAIADRIKEFYNSMQADGVISRQHAYFFQGVSAVCVPQFSFLMERYNVDGDKPNSFPKPELISIQCEWPGDMRTAAFLLQILNHLDLEPEAKRALRRTFQPVTAELRIEKLVDLFDPNWKPTRAPAQISKVLEASGAREYVSRVYNFFAGNLGPGEVAAGLER